MTITLATLNTAPLQEIFDVAATHLLRQGSKSKLDGACAYRGNNGKRCAIGALISDEEYRAEFEGQTSTELLNDMYDTPLPRKVMHLADKLQQIHDLHEPHEWRALLAKLARAMQLNVDCLDTVNTPGE